MREEVAEHRESGDGLGQDGRDLGGAEPGLIPDLLADRVTPLAPPALGEFQLQGAKWSSPHLFGAGVQGAAPPAIALVKVFP